MFCTNCGTSNADNAQFCVSCGQSMSAQPATIVTPSTAPTIIPPGGVETSGKAIASLVCGLFSLMFPAAIAAIILGHISRSEIRKSGGRLKGNGLALTGLIFGYMGIAVIPVLIIAAIAIPNLLRARIAANEASAAAAIRTIMVAELRYRETYPDQGYTCRLENLAGNGSSATAAGLIDQGLASGQKTGYVFQLDECTQESFTVSAQPLNRNVTGVRTFCAKEDGVVRASKGARAECLENGSPL
jgi:hypothetical protein